MVYLITDDHVCAAAKLGILDIKALCHILHINKQSNFVKLTVVESYFVDFVSDFLSNTLPLPDKLNTRSYHFLMIGE